MHTTRKVCIAAAAVTGLFAGPAAAQSVEWKDDGTVLLHLGEAYNDAVIQTTREELGSEFGPDKKPFEGVTITVTVNGAGPKGGICGPLHQFRPIWEELSGGKVNIVELPFAEHYTKMMLDLGTAPASTTPSWSARSGTATSRRPATPIRSTS